MPPTHDDCSRAPAPKLANALALLQEKWSLFIIYTLMSGPIGFNEMSREAGPINTTTLSQRLARLEQAGLVHKTIHSTMPPRTSYELSEAGLALKTVFATISDWSERYMPDQPPECPHD